MFAERFYPFMPVWVQNAGISLYGLGYKRERLGGDFERYVREFRERDGWSCSQMAEYVDQQLRTLLLHAFESVPYYRNKWNAAGKTAKEIGSMSAADLPRLPQTTKLD